MHHEPGRCIIHIDLDCFYCQVEQVERGIPRDTPCAVRQWCAPALRERGASAVDRFFISLFDESVFIRATHLFKLAASTYPLHPKQKKLGTNLTKKGRLNRRQLCGPRPRRHAPHARARRRARLPGAHLGAR
jgi:hypothetical protein